MAVLAGSPFAWQETWATRIGLVVLGLFAGGVAAAIGRRSTEGIWRLLVQYPIIWVNLIAMGSILIGRMGFGPGQATASHYVPFTALFVATALLLSFDQLKNPATRRAALAVTVAALLPLWWLCYQNGVQEASARRQGLDGYRACVLADPDQMAKCDGSRVAPDAATLTRRTMILRQHGLSFFAYPYPP
jgi:hypothetical protein